MAKEIVASKQFATLYRAYQPDGSVWVETYRLNEFLRQCEQWDRCKGELKAYMVRQKSVIYEPRMTAIHPLGKKCRNCGHPKADHNMHDSHGDFFCSPPHTSCDRDCQMYTRQKKA